MPNSPAFVQLLILIGVVVAILVAVLVGSTVLQQRRYLKTRARLGSRLIAIQDEERAAIARELHDDTLQRITVLGSTLRGSSPDRVEMVAAELDRLAGDVRQLARGMHPTVVDHVGLKDALRELARTIQEHEGLIVEYDSPATDDELPFNARLTMYRVAQEALRNVARHAAVDRVKMTLVSTPRDVRLEVVDQGKGFNMAEANAGPGIGVTSMQERLDMLGGTLRFESALNQGTRVIAVLPKGAAT